MTSSEQARLWGALNHLRELAERDYGGGGVLVMAERHQRRSAYAFLAIGFALVVPGLVYVRSFHDLLESTGSAISAIVGMALAGCGAHLTRLSNRRVRRMGAYDRRSGGREAVRSALVELAARTGGRVDEGLRPARAFLAKHWPASAPTTLLALPADLAADSAESRTTLVGEIDGRPLLVAAIDFSAKPLPGARPPLFVCLVASPIVPVEESLALERGPFRGSSRQLEETDAHRTLVREGFAIRWTPAGVVAIRDGNHQPPEDVEALLRIVEAACELCRIVRVREDAPSSPTPVSEDGTTSCRAVLEGFLGAIRDDDAIGILRPAHPRLFLGWAMEPTPEALLAAVGPPESRPRSWADAVHVRASTSGPYTLATLVEVDRSTVNCASFALEVRTPRVGVPARVSMLRMDERHWQVSGYRVGSNQILGVDFPDDP